MGDIINRQDLICFIKVNKEKADEMSTFFEKRF